MPSDRFSLLFTPTFHQPQPHSRLCPAKPPTPPPTCTAVTCIAPAGGSKQLLIGSVAPLHCVVISVLQHDTARQRYVSTAASCQHQAPTAPVGVTTQGTTPAKTLALGPCYLLTASPRFAPKPALHPPARNILICRGLAPVQQPLLVLGPHSPLNTLPTSHPPCLACALIPTCRVCTLTVDGWHQYSGRPLRLGCVPRGAPSGTGSLPYLVSGGQ